MFIRWRADVFNLHRALYYRASHGIFIALPMIQRRSRTGTAKNCQWTMRKTGKLDNKVLDSSPLFHRTGSVSERFRNNVEYRDTKILVEIYIYVYVSVYCEIVTWKFLFFTLTLRKLEDVTVRLGIDSIGREVHGLSKNSLDGLECGGWE